MKERCCRCHTCLTSEDKYHYGRSCEECEQDYLYEEAESNQLIKSPYWKWRAICFALRFLCGVAGRGRDLLLHKLRNKSDGRPELQDVRRER